MKTTASSIELLESRIAPAALYSYTDVDGDTVSVKSSKGNNADLKNLMDFHRVMQGEGFRINEIDLTDVVPASAGEFSNTDLTVSVTRGPHGDGHVDLGYIFAGTMPMHSFIAPKASIQRLDCGDGTNAIGKLQIASYGTAAPAYFNNGIDDSLGVLNGNVGSITIAGDIAYGGLEIKAVGMPATNTVGSIFVGGNLQGNASAATHFAGALLDFAKSTGSIKIGGSILGGEFNSDIVTLNNECGILAGAANKISIGGNIVGGSGANSGFVFAGAKTVSLHGSLLGGSGLGSGLAAFFGNLTSFVMGGDVRGGTKTGSGALFFFDGNAKSVVIKGSVIGGVTDTSGMDHAGAGVVAFTNDIGSLSIGGDLIAGSVTAGDYNFNGSIIGSGNVKSIHIGGSVLGTDSARALILVKGTTPTTGGIFNAIGSLTIGGSLEYGAIASGHDSEEQMGFNPTTSTSLGDALNPDAAIGSVTIGHDFYHSSILAGTNDNNGFGAGRFNAGVNYDTQKIGVATAIAQLGPVVIKGALLDDYSSSAESGFEAEQIKSITVGGAVLFKHGDALRFFDPNHFVFAQEIAPI